MIIRNHRDCGILVMNIAVPIAACTEISTFAEEEKNIRNMPGYIFRHAGDGNIHFNLAGKKGSREECEVINDMVSRVVGKALALGGTATGEHGVGMGKIRFMEAEHGRGLEWMKRIKSLFDPKYILNPAKIFP